MSEEDATLEWHQLTETLMARGIEDIEIEASRTATIGTVFPTRFDTMQEFVTQLPRLVHDNDTNPELSLKEPLGEGGMGLVHLAKQLSLGRDVAVKQIRHASRSNEATMVLLREGWTTGLLEHPNIVPIHTLGRDADGEPLIVMKKISGTSWLDVIRDPDCAPDGFESDDPYELHVEILSQVCNAIHYAHSQGIIHRDLKPDNVMLGEFGEVYVLDWGIAISLDEDPTGRLATASETDEFVGTPAYMAPEMVDSDEFELGIHTDIFLLGAVLMEAITGAPPYAGKTLFQLMFKAHHCEPPEFDPSIPPELVEICKKAMARDPADRFRDARQLRDALQDYRRNREARRLADHGETRLHELHRLVDAEADEEAVDERSLYKVFSECRFAFEQSREIDSDNPRARRGLQEALEVMAERELEHEAPKAAALLIADLPEPNAELRTRLKELAARLATRDENYETLQKISFDVDIDVGRRSRAIFAIIMALFWAVASGVMAFLVESEIVVLTQPRIFGHIVVLTIIISAVVYFGRGRFFENEVNKKILMAAVVTFFCITVHRGMAWIHDIPFRTAVSTEMLMYGMAVVIVAFNLDRRLIWAGLPFIVCAVIGSWWTASILWLFVPANLLGMAFAVWVWWPKDEPSTERAQS